MTTVGRSTAHDSVHGTLVQRAGGALDAGAMVDAVVRTWQYMAAQLAPVIGVLGVRVLFDRALYLTGNTFPWLRHAGEHSIEPAENLKARLVGRDALQVAQAGCAVLVTFTELLAGVMGESLTERLLASVWLPPFPNPDQDIPHE